MLANPRVVRRTASLIALLMGTACADDRMAPAPQAGLTSVASPSDLRGFSADLEMAVTKGGVRSVSRSRIERRETARGKWITRVTRPVVAPFGETGNEKTLVTTVELSDDGSVSTFTSDGTRIPVQSFPHAPPPGKGDAKLRSLPPYPANPGEGRSARDGEAWYDNVVVTPESAARVSARLERRMSRVADASGTLRYIHSGRLQAEVRVDPITGAVLEESTSDPTGRVHAKHSYARLDGGVLVRNHSRIEYRNSGDRNAVVVESTLRNITVARAGQ